MVIDSDLPAVEKVTFETLQKVKKLLMIISGNKQEAATKLLLGDKIDPHCPCTFMRMHRDATVIIEKKLADEIGYKG